jgi:hypothetical protein
MSRRARRNVVAIARRSHERRASPAAAPGSGVMRDGPDRRRLAIDRHGAALVGHLTKDASSGLLRSLASY